MPQSAQFPLHRLTRDEVIRINITRGFMCFYALGFHWYTGYVKPLEWPILDYLFFQAYDGIKAFFAISGFLILHSYVKIQREGWLSPTKVYFIKRFFRIFPTWFLALLIYAIDQKKYEIGEFLWNLFLIFGLTPFKLEQLIVLQSWSLYAEEIFYLTFPLFIFVAKRKLVVHAILIFLLLRLALFYFYTIPEGYILITPFSNFHFFYLGVACYWWLPYFRRISSSSLNFLICLVGFLAFCHLTQNKGPLAEQALFVIFIILAGPPILIKPIRFLYERAGLYCLSFYLAHLICLNKSALYLGRFLPDYDQSSLSYLFILLIVASGVTMVASAILYYLVEGPGIFLGQRILDKQRASKSA